MQNPDPVQTCPTALHTICRKLSPFALFLATTALTSPFLLTFASAQSLPTGGSVAAGSAVIAQPGASSLTVTQSSPSAVVNWQSFSVGQGNSVTFAQPNASSAILNRVTSSAPSTIAGQINSNGQVYLVNPNGIAITKTGTVNTGAFVASTLGIGDSDFMAGRRTFTGNGASASVSNAGTISVGRGGYAALIGGTVSNSGSIDVPLGKVGLGSGERATLDFSGDGFLQVAVPTNAGGKGALIKNSGTIRADGGSVVISAATAREAARNAVNISGTVQARSIGGHSGSIVIGGGAGGRVRITGRLDASSRRHAGGSIQVTGRDIKLKGATIDASGKLGGGAINIGGNYQGTGPLQRAETVSIDKATTIRADARESGNGGNVVVWSDLLTTFAGTISARGGALSGNGGDAEVSGKAKLDYTGTTDLRAPHGLTGTLLLDPYNIVIGNGTQTTDANFNASANDSVINATTLNNALNSANVTITTGATNAPGSQAGNITVAAPVTWSSNSLLTLTAANAIAINAPIAINGGGQLALNTAIASGQPLLSFGNGASINFASGQSGQALSINGNAYTLVYTMAQLDAIDGANAANNNAAVTQYGAGLGGRYALAGNLNAAGTTYTWGIIAGTDPIITGQYLYFTGTLEGLGHTISNLTITASTRQNVGLIGTLAGTLRDIGVVGGIVSGNAYVGGLVGYNYGGTITQSYATGTVVGGTSQYSSGAGGLVGVNTGAIILSYATGAVSGFAEVGGLVGYSYGTIAQSYATGAVSAGSGSYDLGGLAGRNYGGSITQSYATGAVSGGSNASHVGGFVGENTYSTGTITQSYATGAVTAGSGSSSVGGFAGNNVGGATISQSYWDTTTSGRSTSAGGAGVTGVTTAQLADATRLAALNGGGVVWGNANNQTVPYLLNNVGPVFLGSDSSATPTLYTPITTQAQLEAVNNRNSANYALLNNLDLSGTTYTAAVIGTFSGTLDGLGNTIANLTITGSSNYVGLIGTLNNGGTVRSLGIAGGSVSGYNGVGGLVGQNYGTITRAYATGAVSGSGLYVGGLVGYNNGSITQAYATGAVGGGGTDVGGLVGANYGGSITQAYATGAVSGGSYVGGLVGFNTSGIAQAYWDTQTSGQPVTGVAGGSSTGVTGYTTRQLQGLDPISGSVANNNAVYFSTAGNLGSNGTSAFAGGTGGLYPYLTSFFPNGVQAVSGMVYSDGGVTTRSGASVTVLNGNAAFGTAFTGANGYYYAFGPANSIASGTSVVAYTGSNAGIAKSTGSANTGGIDLFGNVTLLAGRTAQTTWSSAGLDPSTLPSVPTGGAVPSFLTGALPTYVATNAQGFTFDTPLTVSNPFAVQTVAANAPITVSQPITVSNNSGLGLNAAGALTVNANIAVNGAGKVALAYDQNTTAASINDLSFGLTGSGFAGSLTYLDSSGAAITSSAGGSLSINGTSYSLLYNFVDLAGASNGLSSAYALAGNLDGTNHNPFNRVIVNGLTKTLEGLGHTVANVTINGTSSDASLIGDLYSGGTVRDLGVVGGSVSGISKVGALVGYNQGGSITQAYATAAVSSSSGSYVGGLVGYNSGTIMQAYATGAVSGANFVGGLVGYNDGGSITQAYAMGAVGGSGSHVGGLVGSNGGSITQAYATGAVSGSSNYVGGLVGDNGGSITQVYATGAVSGSGNSIGGLVGKNVYNITQAYWDTQTSGRSNSIGFDSNNQSGNVTGLTTAQLQSNYGGFISQLGSAFSGGTNGLYPYLTSFFPNGVQAVSGFAYRDAGATPLASGATGAVGVTVVGVNTALGTATTGNNGYYYVFGQPGTIANGASVIAYTTANNATGATNAARIATSTYATNTPLQTGLDIWAPVTLLAATTSAITYSDAVTAGFNPASLPTLPTGSTIPAFLTSAIPTLAATNAQGFTFDTPSLAVSNAFAVQTTASGAPITVSQPITINAGGSLGLLAAGSLTVNNTITVNGAASVNLGYDQNTTTASINDLSFGFTAAGFAGSLTYAASGGALSINGNAYALIASMADLIAINGSSRNYALANNLTSGSYNNAVVASFGGTLEGLGHSVNGLTINSTGSNIGLIGSLTGQVRDLGLVGGSVSGGDTTGALVGNNQGTITNVFTTASVTGGDNVGGLVGDNSGGISYAIAAGSVSGSGTVGGMVGSTRGPLQMVLATGTVSGNGGVGGLVGSLAPCGNCANSDGATIVNAMATGAVSGANSAGGLVANLGATGGLASISMMNVFATGAVSSGIGYGGGLGATVTGNVANGISDSQTTGQPNFGTYTGSPPQSGVNSGYTTAYLQNNAAGILGAAFGGGSNGVYPYLKTFFPNGVQAVSGFAYKDAGATPLASGVNGAVPVTVVGANSTLGTATTGNNGYYYVFGQPGTIANGASVIAYTTANNATGATNAARIATSTYATNTPAQTGVNIYEPVALAFATTTQTTYSGYLASVGGTLPTAPTVPTGTAVPGFVSSAIPSVVAIGAGFTFDTQATFAAPFGFATAASGAAITVSSLIAVSNTGSLGLSAAGALNISSNITVNGAGSVALAYDTNTTTASINDLSFGLTGSGFTGSLTYAGTGGKLAINGNPYTLIYSMADLDGIDGFAAVANGAITSQTAGLSGRYALAGNLDASGTTYTDAIVAGQSGGQQFSGTLEGLGHTVANLTINAGNNGLVGLIGTLASGGTVRDIGTVGGSVSGYNAVGGLVGFNNVGSIAQAYATGAVNGASIYVGGLVGVNNGSLTQAYATGAVVGSGNYVGGLVGANTASIVQAYATGAVSGSSADVGGLVGYNPSGRIVQSYATGAVSGASYVGGLVGFSGGGIAQAYATGAVSGSSNVGGLAGANGGSIVNGYYDAMTAGQPAGLQADGSTGLTTSQLQSNANGFMTNLGPAFSSGTGGLYPYLTNFFPNGVQAVSGFAYKDAGATPLASSATGAVGVTVVGANTALGTATTGNNGYYYVFGQPNTLPINTTFIAYTTTNNATGATNAARIATSTYTSGTPVQTGVDIWAPVTLFAATTSAITYSDAVTAGFNPASLPALPTGSAIPSFLTGAIPTLATSGASFTFDTPLNVTNTFAVQTVTSNAPITVSNPITIGGGNSLGLYAAGALAINANITVNGAGGVALATGLDTTTVPGTSFAQLAFAQGASLSFANANGSAATSAVNGQTLAINGQSYTLLYNMTDVVGVNANLARNYALAGNLDAGGNTYTTGVIAGGTQFGASATFGGTLEGLGHTVSNLTITGNSGYAGLIGLSAGTVRDIGLVGGSVHGAGIIGNLVGSNLGTIVNATASGAVSGNSFSFGGLVGENYGAIVRAAATGAVTGHGSVGGLVGKNGTGGTITQSYATGAVYADGGTAGGLVGVNVGGTITQTYATGAVSGPNPSGGLVGYNNASGLIAQSYWDTQTSGRVAGIGQDDNTGNPQIGNVTGLTTAQLQGTSALPNGMTFNLGSAFAGGAAGATPNAPIAQGLYPYLASFAPYGMQAITGTAYSDAGATPLASNASGAVTIGLDANGTRVGTATTGANGYYYIATPLVAPFTPAVTNGQNLLAYNAATNAARLVTASGGALQIGLNLYGNTLAVETNATLFSNAPQNATAARTANAAALATAAGTDANATAAYINATGLGLISSGSTGFTIDTTPTINSTLVVETCACAPLTVNAPITVASGQSLGLLSGGVLTINAPIAVNGAGSVALAAGLDTTTVPGTSFAQLAFAQGAPLTFANADGSAATSAVTGQKLAINGQSYTLLYNMADVANVNTLGLAGNYAIATNIDAGGNSYTTGVIAGGNPSTSPTPFSGTFEGLGHTVANLTITDSSNNHVGLIGSSTGTVRDIGMVGGSVAGANYVGGLVGYNSGAVVNAYVTGAVKGRSFGVGGLVGESNGAVVRAYATGAVTGYGNVGGLVGSNDANATIAQSYATGAVAVSGGTAGGLAGYNNGAIIQGYATGAVSHTPYATIFGGLVGYNNSSGTIAQAYWDTQTSGQPTGIGIDTNANAQTVTGLTTAQFQSGSASGLGSAYAGGIGGLYPYLKTFFPNGVQAVSGFAYTDAGATLAASGANGAVSVSVVGGGAPFATATTGINGAYYAFGAAGMLAGGSSLLAYTQANMATGANDAATYTIATADPNNTGVNVYGGWKLDRPASSIASLSALNAFEAAAAGSSPAAALVINNREIRIAAPTFSLDAATSLTGTLALNSTGAVTQTSNGAITAGALSLTGTAGSYTLTQTANAVGTIAGDTGSIAFADSAALATGSVTSTGNTATAGVTTTGSVSLATSGNLTLASGAPVSGASPVLSTGAAFINNAGATGVTASTGRFLVWSQDPANDTIGGLTYAFRQYNAPFGTTPAASGSGLLYTLAPTANLDANSSFDKTYDKSATTRLLTGAGLYISSGGVAGDVVTARAGTTGTFNSVNVGTNIPVSIDSSAVTFADANGRPVYGYQFNSLITGNITPKLLSVNLSVQNKVYDGTGNATFVLSSADVVAGDAVTFTAAQAPAFGNRNVGTYTLQATGITLGGADATNYAPSNSGAAAQASITPRPLTITADAQSRVYGDANPALTYTIGGMGFANGEALAGALATTATSASGVGVYAITQGTLLTQPGNVRPSNYTITYVGANLSVTPRALTVAANAQSRVYGDANPALTYQTSGLVNSDGLTGGLTTSANLTSNVGAYAITQGSLAASSNYTLTYTGANLSVTPRALTVTADAKSRVYGDANPALTYQTSGLVNGDALTVALTTSATTTSNVGNYAITQNTLAASSNYALAYIGANLSVTPRTLTITADAKSRIYGDANPALTYTFSGLVNGDGLTGALATSATATSNVGSYGITQNTLAASSNYALSYIGANLTVTPRALTVTADAQSRIYGDANPALTYQASGLVNGDGLTGALGTSATTASNIGSYGITQSTLAASSNYALSYIGANLTVTPRALTATADARSRAYGDPNPALTYQTSGLVNGDGLTGALATSATTTSGVGAYAIAQNTLAASSNYILSFTGANLLVTPAPVAVTAIGGTSVVGSSPANPGLSATGLKNGEGVAVLTGLDNSFGITSASSAAGSPYTLTVVGTLGNPNYVVAQRIAGLWTVTSSALASEWIASVIVNDNFYPTALPDNATPVFGSPPILTSLGTGTLYADPRFSNAYVCFGMGQGRAAACYGVGL